jgi:hypothetical protein
MVFLSPANRRKMFTQILRTRHTGGWVGELSLLAAIYGREKNGRSSHSNDGYADSLNVLGFTISNLPTRGQTDFQDDFREEGIKGDYEDQSHHAAAFFG